MEKIWLKHYPPDVPPEVDINEYASLLDFFTRNVERFGNSSAFSNMGRELSYFELNQFSRRFAGFLQQDLKMDKGERIAIMLPNSLQYPVTMFGAFMAGLTVVNTNPLYTARELKHQLLDSQARTIVIIENYAHVLAEVIKDTQIEHVILTRIGDLLSFPKSVAVNFAVKYVKKMVPRYALPKVVPLNKTLRKDRAFRSPKLTHDDIAFLQYTGGTTGTAKGAMLTHGNMIANVVQATAWFDKVLTPEKEIVVTALPLYHIFSLTANCLLFMNFGGLNYLITNPRDMAGFVRELSRVKFTCMTGVNTLFNALMNDSRFATLDFSHLKVVLGGGMAVQTVVAKRWKEMTGTTLIEAYGLTETAPAVCINPLTLEEYNGSIGLPISSTECSIRNDESQCLPSGEVGELCVRGPQVMKGYWRQPKETEKVLSADGWLRTGDMATMDSQGFIRIVDRKKDMIIVSGFNVYPNEIEGIIAEHPGVLEVGVFGFPDEQSGETVKAVIVKKDPALTVEEINEYCKINLTAYKRPKRIEFASALPKTNVGKILRRQLRDQFSSEK